MLVKGVQSYGDFPREQFRELRDDVVKAAISTPENVKRVFMVPLLTAHRNDLHGFHCMLA